MSIAIEIDPAIAFLGTKYHPERPYDDLALRCRSSRCANFFRTGRPEIRLIVYGVLDRHTALSMRPVCAWIPTCIPRERNRRSI